MKAKIYITLLFLLAINPFFTQTKCDSISFSPDTLYIDEETDFAVYDTMYWVGETELGFAMISFQFDDTTFIDINDSHASPGTWGPYTFVNTLGSNVLYYMVDIPENTVVHAQRVVQHHSLESTCVKPVTFVINPSSSASLKEMERQNSFKMYPNPAQDEITLEFEKSVTQLNILVTDLQGRVKANHENFSGQKINLDVHEFAEGAYTVSVNNLEGNLKTQQLMIVK